MSRPVGADIVQLCAAMERTGPLSTDHVVDSGLCDRPPARASKLLQRLVRMGLLTADRSVSPTMYAAAQDWREKLRPAPRKAAPMRVRASSVWDLGMMA